MRVKWGSHAHFIPDPTDPRKDKKDKWCFLLLIGIPFPSCESQNVHFILHWNKLYHLFQQKHRMLIKTFCTKPLYFSTLRNIDKRLRLQPVEYRRSCCRSLSNRSDRSDKLDKTTIKLPSIQIAACIV